MRILKSYLELPDITNRTRKVYIALATWAADGFTNTVFHGVDDQVDCVILNYERHEKLNILSSFINVDYVPSFGFCGRYVGPNQIPQPAPREWTNVEVTIARCWTGLADAMPSTPREITWRTAVGGQADTW